MNRLRLGTEANATEMGECSHARRHSTLMSHLRFDIEEFCKSNVYIHGALRRDTRRPPILDDLAVLLYGLGRVPPSESEPSERLRLYAFAVFIIFSFSDLGLGCTFNRNKRKYDQNNGRPQQEQLRIYPRKILGGRRGSARVQQGSRRGPAGVWQRSPSWRRLGALRGAK